MKKSLLTLTTAAIMAASISITVFAGEWQFNNEEWQYQNDDGTFVEEGWHRESKGI